MTLASVSVIKNILSQPEVKCGVVFGYTDNIWG